MGEHMFYNIITKLLQVIILNAHNSSAPSLFQVYENALKVRNYSPRTIRIYLGVLRAYIRFYYPSHPRQLNSEHVRGYLLHLLEDKNLTRASVDQAINALKFLYVNLYKRTDFIFEIQRPRKEHKLPVVLSREEVLSIARAAANPRYRLMIELMYSSGLRVSEVLRIKVKDLNFDELTLFVRGGKGHKDRLTIFSGTLKHPLLREVEGKSAKDLLFPALRGGKLTIRTLQKAFTEAQTRSGIKKNASCHSLRHSFATHLLEAGVDIRYIQSLLGHARIETTNIYTKVRNPHLFKIVNPL